MENSNSQSPQTKPTFCIKVSNLEVRLAQSPDEVTEAQRLRYKIFYEEMGAKATPETLAQKSDSDAMDDFCDHLLVLNPALAQGSRVIGTYRLIRREAAAKNGSFYSASEYDITPIINYPGEILELGRSCIHADYRTGTVMQGLWRGISAYVVHYGVKLMFGCASLPGIDPQALALPLSYLYYHHLAPPALRVKALPERYTAMNILPREAFDPQAAFNTMKLDPRAGGNSLPPLLKGYLRVGCCVGDGAVIDHQFNTTDVCIIIKTELITNRYLRHYDFDDAPNPEQV